MLSSDGADAAGAAEGKCPFLAQLKTPPMVNIRWFQRVQFQVCMRLGWADQPHQQLSTLLSEAAVG